jgi:dTDP-4-dehydrorhamnose reductase
MRRIGIFGASGMLGAYVEAYFRRNDFDVVTFARGDVLTEPNALRARLESVGSSPMWLINCVGVIKPQVAEQGVAETIRVNSLFPHILARVGGELGHHVLHITTDCVFSGATGGYGETSPHDELDIYGRTKSLGEPESCMVIRTSIIGEERFHKRSLIEWAKSQAGKEVRGFTNHSWNGVTCLEFAKVAHRLIDAGTTWRGVRHVFSPTAVNKLELLGLLDAAFALRLSVKPFETPTPCFRTLRSNYPEITLVCRVPELSVQLQDLKVFTWS